jgi:predicted RNA-binding Zn ribbon-like protein
MDTSQPAIPADRAQAAYPPPWVWEFPFRSGRLCLDFVSTLGSRGQLDLERFRDPADLERWVIQAGLGKPGQLDNRDLAAALTLREAIYPLVTNRRSRRPQAIAAVNCAAAATPLAPRLDKTGEVLTWAPIGGVNQVLSTIARDAIDLLASPMRTRVRECARPDCTIVFLDTSRPGTRRWCSMEACGNQLKSESLRAKRRAVRASEATGTSPR